MALKCITFFYIIIYRNGYLLTNLCLYQCLQVKTVKTCLWSKKAFFFLININVLKFFSPSRTGVQVLHQQITWEFYLSEIPHWLTTMLLVLYVEREKPFLDVFVSLASDHPDLIYRRAGNPGSSYATQLTAFHR